jgi:hypothetical protein
MDDTALLSAVFAFGLVTMTFPVMTRWRYANGRISAAQQGDYEVIGLLGFVPAATAALVLWAIDRRRHITEGYYIESLMGAYASIIVFTSCAIPVVSRWRQKSCLIGDDLLFIVGCAGANLVLGFVCFWSAMIILCWR